MGSIQFLSDRWLDALCQIAQQLLDEGTAPDRRISYGEMIHAVPAAFGWGEATGYVLSFEHGKAEMVRASAEDSQADCRVRCDYAVALATLSKKSGPDLDALVEAAFADGSMTMSGSPKLLPINMSRLHDRLVDETACD